MEAKHTLSGNYTIESFESLVAASEKKMVSIVGFFSTAFDAEQVAANPQWANRGAYVVELRGAPGDRFAVVRCTM